MSTTKSEVTTQVAIDTAEELIQAIIELTPVNTHVTYVYGKDGERLKVQLIENTLTDGSTTWDIKLVPVE